MRRTVPLKSAKNVDWVSASLTNAIALLGVACLPIGIVGLVHGEWRGWVLIAAAPVGVLLGLWGLVIVGQMALLRDKIEATNGDSA